MITKQFVLVVHTKLILQFGGLDGIRDEDLLESALARPKNLKAYGKNLTTLHLGASLAYGIIQNHPFIDGNKRVGMVLCELILAKDGYTLTATEEEKYVIFMQVASGKISEEELVKWLSKNSKK